MVYLELGYVGWINWKQFHVSYHLLKVVLFAAPALNLLTCWQVTRGQESHLKEHLLKALTQIRARMTAESGC